MQALMKKSQVLEILQAMPDEFPVDELIEELRVLQKTEADLRQVPGGHTHPEGAVGHQPVKPPRG